MKRLIIVYNPNSSQYVHVKEEILARVNELNGFAVGKFAIKKVSFEKNVESFAKILEDKDIVLIAGGDGTASVAVNGILKSDKDIKMMVLPYGNFNDLARTLGTARVTAGGGPPKCFSLEKILGGEAGRTRPYYPLEIFVDGKFWRYATCYVTIGMTAEAVEIFDEPKIRKKLQKGHKSSWRSYAQLAAWYFKNRRKKVFLPEFKVNGVLQKKKTSDYAAVNGKSMCRVMRGGEDYLDAKIFRSMTEKTISFPRLFMLMARSILKRVPGKETTGDVLEFSEPATVELQAEGEYQVFKNVRKIEIRKGKKCLKVMQKR